jgi:hypothetical protein
MIPPFDPTTGYLPPGEHPATWQEVVDRFGWTPKRKHLLSGLRRMAMNLHQAGCRFFLLDGSFVTAKDEPGDYDACCDFSNIDVSVVDDRFAGTRLEMKLEYFGELFAEQTEAIAGYTFREFFQSDRDGAPKGVILLNLGTVQ